MGIRDAILELPGLLAYYEDGVQEESGSGLAGGDATPVAPYSYIDTPLGRAIDLSGGYVATPYATLRNLIANPSFELNTTGIFGTFAAGDWAVTTAARSSAWAKNGAWSYYLKLTKGATATNSQFLLSGATGTSGMPVTAGNTYLFRYSANVLDAAGSGVNAFIFWYDAAGAFLSAANSNSVTSTGEFDLSVVGVAPAGAAFAAWGAYVISATSSDVFEGYFDSMLFTEIPSPFGIQGALQHNFSGDGTAPLGNADTGQPWDSSVYGGGAGLSAATQMAIVANRLTNTTVATSEQRGYAQANIGATVRRAGARFTFSAGATNTGFAAILGGEHVDNAADISNLSLALHAKVGPALFVLELVEDGVFTTLYSKPMAPNLTKDDATIYEMELLVVGDTIYFRLPDGGYHSARDPRIASLPGGPWVTYEVAQANPSTDDRPKFTLVWADTATPAIPAYFDGTTHADSSWEGTAHASVSARGPFANGSVRTFIAFAKNEDTTQTDVLIGSHLSALYPTLRLTSGGSLQFRSDVSLGGTSATLAAGAVLLNRWHALAAMFDDVTDVASVRADDAEEIDAAATTPYTGLHTLRIGAAGTTGQWTGPVAHVAIFNRALTAAEIRRIRLGLTIADEVVPGGVAGHDPRTFTLTRKAGVSLETSGSVGVAPEGRQIDIGPLIIAGGLTTQDPELASAIEGTGLFDLTVA